MIVQGSSWQEGAEDAPVGCGLPNHGELLNDVTGFRLAVGSEMGVRRYMVGSGHDFSTPRPPSMSRFEWLSDHNGMYTGIRLVKENT
jgi:hypothetical protein